MSGSNAIEQRRLSTGRGIPLVRGSDILSPAQEQRTFQESITSAVLQRVHGIVGDNLIANIHLLIPGHVDTRNGFDITYSVTEIDGRITKALHAAPEKTQDEAPKQTVTADYVLYEGVIMGSVRRQEGLHCVTSAAMVNTDIREGKQVLVTTAGNDRNFRPPLNIVLEERANITEALKRLGIHL